MILSTNTLVIALLILMLVITIDAFLLRMKMRRMMRCKAGDVGDALISLDKDVKALEHFQKEAEGYFQNVEKRLRRSIQSIDTARFNAFKGEGLGGNQSFATAFVNEDGDGVIVSSLYSRDRVSVFGKPVSHFASELELSEEEANVLGRAKAKVSK
jgi:hypothetical protein